MTLASLAVHVQKAVPLRLSLRATESTKSTQIPVLIAALAQVLALLKLSQKANSLYKNKGRLSLPLLFKKEL